MGVAADLVTVVQYSLYKLGVLRRSVAYQKKGRPHIKLSKRREYRTS
jgi:hypothetical protein